MTDNAQFMTGGALSRRPGLTGRIAQILTKDTNVVVIFAVIQNLMRAVSGMILTRLLVPEAFGITGIIGSVAFTAAMLSDLGFQPFVVRHEDGDSPRFLDTIWTIALGRSLVLTVALLALAEPIAHMLAKPELSPMIAVAAVLFAVEGFGSLTLLTAVRNKQILRLSMLELGVLIIQIGSSVVLALIWRDVWAILAALVISSVSKTVLSYIVFANSRRRLAFDRGYATDLWHFARYVTGASMITLLLSQFDKLLLARLMPLDDFGLYILAGNLASAPVAFTAPYASRVLYPTYAELWRRKEGDLRAMFYAKKWLPSHLYSFAAGGLIGVAPFLVALLYDDRYLHSGVFLRLLAITPFFALASASAGEALTATGRISANFHASMAKLVWLAVATPVTYFTVGTPGLVAMIGLMEVPAMLLKWIMLFRAGLLDIRKEMLIIGTGVVGMLIGVAGGELLWPLVG